MSKKRYLVTWEELFERIQSCKAMYEGKKVYGVPTGGMIVSGFLKDCQIVTDPSKADVIIDDIVDSGETKRHYLENFPTKMYIALWDSDSYKTDYKFLKNYWLDLPWEVTHPNKISGCEQNIVRILEYIGEDPSRNGLINTPKRVIKSYQELFSGYDKDPKNLFTSFENEECYDEIVLLKNIEFHSMCEHHMLPFSGKAHVAYIPKHYQNVIGISKLARLVDIFAKRLQNQERLCSQVTDNLMKHLQCHGAACIIEAKHNCIACRGVHKQNSVMVTSSIKGAFFEKPEARAELMQLIKS